MSHVWLEEMEGDLAEQYLKKIRGGCSEWERLPYGGTFDWERDSDLSDSDLKDEESRIDDESTYDDESDQNSDEESSMDSVEEEEDTSLGIGEAFTIAVNAT
jgi:hypothetical protein